ncbi:MAG TPA: MFS transporter [Bryobacterales bacterium]|nr:MFS transporter [Bryobacterales bacterium]
MTSTLTAEQIATRLERAPVSMWHVQARVLVGIATFFDGVDALTIAYVLPALIGPWHISPRSVGLLISAGYAGQLVGAIFFGWLAERVGRLAALSCTILVYSVCSLLCMVSWSYSSLLIFRTLQGLGLGGEVPIAAAYINELAAAKTRGRFVLTYELVFPAGRVAAALLGVSIVARLGWRYMFLIGGLPALLIFGLRRALPESPRWLASQGRLREADWAVQQIEQGALWRNGQLAQHNAAAGGERMRAKAEWADLFRGIYRWRTLLAWVLWFSAYLVLNGLSTWVPTLYRTVFRTPIQTSLRYGLFTSAAGLVGCVAVALLVDRTGRRTWFAASFLLGGLAFLALWLTGASTPITVLSYTCAGSFFANSIAMLLFLYTPEIYPTRIRALGSSVASAWLRLASIIGPLLIGYTIGHYSLALVFLEFGCVCLAAFGASLLCVETGGWRLEKISP